MKATGIVRKIDELGRIVLPVELRRILDWNEKDSLEIYTDEVGIYLRKYEHTCSFCGSKDDLLDYQGKKICDKCIRNINALKEAE